MLTFSEFVSPDAPFVKVFSLPHIIYLIASLSCLALFIHKRAWVKMHENAVRITFLLVLGFQQIFLLYGWYAFFTPNFLSEGLPLHLSRVSSLLTIIYLFKKSDVVIDVISYFSIFALISFFYPLNVYNFSHASGVSYMINHLITVLIPPFASICTGWFPTWRSYKHAVIGFSIFLPLAIVANIFTGGNYFYQTDRPFWHDLSAISFAILSYVVPLVAFAVVTFFVIALKKLYETKWSKRNF